MASLASKSTLAGRTLVVVLALALSSASALAATSNGGRSSAGSAGGPGAAIRPAPLVVAPQDSCNGGSDCVRHPPVVAKPTGHSPCRTNLHNGVFDSTADGDERDCRHELQN